MTEGRYLYCILEGTEAKNLGKVGIHGGEVRVLPYESVGAVISPIPFSEMESNLENILVKLKDKDEFGVKVILNDAGLKRIRESVEAQSEEVAVTKRNLPKSGRGTSYLLNLKIEEAIKNQLYKKIEELSQQIYTRLGAPADERTVLKSDHDQIILNAAYLINRSEIERFQKEVEAVKRDFGWGGLIVHTSGPWAPYSFC